MPYNQLILMNYKFYYVYTYNISSFTLNYDKNFMYKYIMYFHISKLYLI